ncbi:MAG: FHA domain-containing protein [Bacteroidaceae bacterium]|nr:FHA domain-containing protein [Bacteroidaceae bacterium]
MKRVKCPKCDNYISFDETKYTEGQSLVFQCPQCNKQFGIRIGVSALHKTHKEERQEAAAGMTTDNQEQEGQTYGSVIVVENVFHYRQVLPLQLGDNVIGRYVRGTGINTPIETVDPSVDTTHCVINVSVSPKNKSKLIYTLRDAPSGTGTFVGNTILRDQDRLRIEDGTIITIGATTMILQAGDVPEEETTAAPKRHR